MWEKIFDKGLLQVSKKTRRTNKKMNKKASMNISQKGDPKTNVYMTTRSIASVIREITHKTSETANTEVQRLCYHIISTIKCWQGRDTAGSLIWAEGRLTG